ncbi:MAG TPA: carboxymuconolactone decarboxylase family protein [Burkholderiales bacterium]|nr:carboxymuconolactone decarboxylase family protein [Burkholderiales bacterium]
MRLPTITDDTTDPKARAVLDEIRAKRGFVSNALRSMAHSPDLLRAFVGVGTYVKFGSSLSWRARELVIMTAGRKVDYEWKHHYPLAIDAGVPAAALEDIHAGRTPESLPASERALVKGVIEMFAPDSISDATFAALSEHWTPQQIVDMLVTAVYYQSVAVIATALQVELEDDETIFATERAWQKPMMNAKSSAS